MSWSITGDTENAGQYYAILEHTNGIHIRVDVYTGDSASSIYDVEDADDAITTAVALLDADSDFTSLGTAKSYTVSESYTP